ncbi:hypothetical protein BGX27_000524 [Mortierella sp. AM989]|nr:hypothetical protein BGX27_000524 [Mortierella sp. AM989]
MTAEVQTQTTEISASNKRPDTIDIGDGLIMRWSTRKDAENVARLLALAFRWITYSGPELKEGEGPEPSESAHAVGKRLLRGNSGVMSEFDYALVENTLAKDDENPILACVCLHGTMGYYGKVQLLYGRPEVVACHPDSRNRGFIRRLFLEMIHPASEARGDVIQVLPGIPYFYRQFGYEYAIGNRTFRRIDDIYTAFPQLDLSKKNKEKEEASKSEKGTPVVVEEQPFSLRAPTLDDIPYLVKMSTPEKMLNQAEVGLTYDEKYWRYTIHDLIETEETKYDVARISRVIVDSKTGQDCGIVVTKRSITSPDPALGLFIFTLEDGYHYRDALHSVLGQMIELENQPSKWELKEIEEQQDKAEKGDKQEPEVKPKPAIKSLVLHLDPNHPVMKLVEAKSKFINTRFKLYTRVLSYAKFILKVAPTLEDRLAKSHLSGITVTWHFNFFRKVLGSCGKGLEVVFKDGKIVSASDDWVQLSPEEKLKAALDRIEKAKQEGTEVECIPKKKPLEFLAEFAPLTFSRLLLGDLSIEQMLDFYGESSVSGGDDAEAMLNILFPKQLFHNDMFWW